jgi:mRNA-degrading endonuclease RelE of RelBE toxin-antitoxin system
LNLQVRWQPSALRELGRLDRPVQERILESVERLALTGQGDVKALRGQNPREYRLRVGGWRVRFGRDDAAGLLIVLHVFRRGQGYE